MLVNWHTRYTIPSQGWLTLRELEHPAVHVRLAAQLIQRHWGPLPCHGSSFLASVIIRENKEEISGTGTICLSVFWWRLLCFFSDCNYFQAYSHFPLVSCTLLAFGQMSENPKAWYPSSSNLYNLGGLAGPKLKEVGAREETTTLPQSSRSSV